MSRCDPNDPRPRLLLWCAAGLLVALTRAQAATHYVDAASTNAVPPFINCTVTATPNDRIGSDTRGRCYLWSNKARAWPGARCPATTARTSKNNAVRRYARRRGKSRNPVIFGIEPGLVSLAFVKVSLRSSVTYLLRPWWRTKLPRIAWHRKAAGRRLVRRGRRI